MTPGAKPISVIFSLASKSKYISIYNLLKTLFLTFSLFFENTTVLYVTETLCDKVLISSFSIIKISTLLNEPPPSKCKHKSICNLLTTLFLTFPLFFEHTIVLYVTETCAIKFWLVRFSQSKFLIYVKWITTQQKQIYIHM